MLKCGCHAFRLFWLFLGTARWPVLTGRLGASHLYFLGLQKSSVSTTVCVETTGPCSCLHSICPGLSPQGFIGACLLHGIVLSWWPGLLSASPPSCLKLGSSAYSLLLFYRAWFNKTLKNNSSSPCLVKGRLFSFSRALKQRPKKINFLTTDEQIQSEQTGTHHFAHPRGTCVTLKYLFLHLLWEKCAHLSPFWK